MGAHKRSFTFEQIVDIGRDHDYLQYLIARYIGQAEPGTSCFCCRDSGSIQNRYVRSCYSKSWQAGKFSTLQAGFSWYILEHKPIIHELDSEVLLTKCTVVRSRVVSKAATCAIRRVNGQSTQ